ncbi:MAG TPA: 50S ribosomal protein L4 [Candidatus Omnitrophota bacterium]|nr:50S ribosomal protein L4 [Candidatus Omnitrophota bacterium]HPD83965.1 50S ribosomal protein L4 [Candidatus Omnitrophota bacterium]HRZ02822.1 50S ribosomal protein L4 [Candidatus Omnitrophota bacterium]
MPLLPIINNQGQKVEDVELPDTLFGGPVNQDVIHQAVVMYNANHRQGNASTKERGAVSGGGKKPFRQKGTGRARAGSIRSPLWHGGGVVFGPHPRDFSYSIPQKMKVAALRESINAKYHSKDLLCVDRLTVTSPKTKDFVKTLIALKLTEGKTLALLDTNDPDIKKVSRNIPFFSFMRAEDVNAYDILRNQKILVTKAALKNLLKRIK